MKIEITASPSESTERKFTINLNDLGLTEKEWNKLSEQEKNKLLQAELDGMPEQPYWALDNYCERE